MNSIRRNYSKCFPLAALLALAGLTTPATAQEPGPDHLEDMRRNVSIFEGVLREALELDARRTVFSARAGQVQGHYLAGQGVVMELTAPLQMGRRGSGLRRLDDAVTALGRQLEEPRQVIGGLVRRPDTDAMRESMALSLRRDQAGQYYRDLMERLSDLDSAQAMDNAVRLAGEAAEALQGMAEVDELQLAQWRDELDELRDRLEEHLRQLSGLREAVRETAADEDGDAGAGEPQRQSWESALADLQTQWPALRDQAHNVAQDLRQRSLQYREQQQQAWRDDVEAFERRLYDVLCRYGASVRLPDGEYVTVVLSGLGESGPDEQRPADRIHVIGGEALQACQRGDIDTAALMDGARAYSF
ncbi:MAG: hypothetical protein WEB57_06345 [Pseudohongiellaceae bacterium]